MTSNYSDKDVNMHLKLKKETKKKEQTKRY